MVSMDMYGEAADVSEQTVMVWKQNILHFVLDMLARTYM